LEHEDPSVKRASPPVRFDVLTPARWADVERLFGPRGACAGCWCMWPRLTSAEFAKGRGDGNRRAFRRVVESGERPGILAYADGQPVGWCAVAPREVYRRLERSRVLKPVDDQRVWSVVCFFVARPLRRRGLTVRLLREAVRFAANRGARIIEGYPVEPRAGRTADAFAWTGLSSAFRRAGFKEVLRRSETRPIMRYVIRSGARVARGSSRRPAVVRGEPAGSRGSPKPSRPGPRLVAVRGGGRAGGSAARRSSPAVARAKRQRG
jgi:GNAT superfamily N-acetyltransferase